MHNRIRIDVGSLNRSMNYLKFKEKMVDLGCFNTHQVYAWAPDFDRNNFVRWTKKGLLIRLRQGFYTFPEYKSKPGYPLYFANRMYRPSYISLHTALAFYGMIPEAVVQITSVTSLKTAYFQNAIGEYQYRSLRKELMFGYEIKAISEGKSLLLAQPEKALLDLLYLYPFYKTSEEMTDLRLDEDFLHEELDFQRLRDYSSKYESKALQKRVHLLKSTYNL